MNSKQYIHKISLLLVVIFSFLSCNRTNETKWIALTDTNSLDGWEVKNGIANYVINGDEIIGTTQMNSPNTFLCTKQQYGDFILEFEVQVDSSINSGVQFRSNSSPDFENGRVHGYQAEIDPSKRAWSGGIYEEGKRGWLYDLKDHPIGQKAFKNGEWNHYRIQAIGDEIAVWVNQVNTANLKDNAAASGFIGLQVHSISDSTQAGKTIKWRNIKIITENISSFKTSANAPQLITSN